MIVNSGLRRFSGGGVNGKLSFAVDLQSSLVPRRSRGSPTPTYTNTSTRYVADWENLYKAVLSDEARFTGARRVENLVLVPENSAAWTLSGTGTVTTEQTDPSGGSTAFAINLPAASDNVSIGILPVIGTLVTPSCYIKADSTGTIRFVEGASGTWDQTLNITTAWQRFSVAAATVGAGAGKNLMWFRNGAGQLSKIYVWHPQVEPVTGQSNQNPSEYVSVGVLAAPYHGANVDAVKYFTTKNGNTVSSNVVTENVGAAINLVNGGNALTVDAGGPFGYFAEGSATQLVTPTASIRNMTDASWTLGATLTRAFTSTGIDGVATSATRLTAGAVAATNIITQTLVAAASSRTYSCFIKRITGTGPVRLTQDNFVGGTDISGSLINGTWVKVSFNASILNAVYGIKVDTNLDAIDVDFNQFEALEFASSPLAAAGAARNSDALTYSYAGNVAVAMGSSYAEISVNADVLPYSRRAITVGAGGRLLVLPGTLPVTTISVVDSGTVTKTGLTSMLDAPRKRASAWGGIVMRVTGDGSIPESGAFDGAMGTAVDLSIGHNTNINNLYGTIRNVRIYATALTDAQLQAMTT